MRRLAEARVETFLTTGPLGAPVTAAVGYTRFEKARIVGARALQISMGAPSLDDDGAHGDPLSIATSEFASGSSPMNVQRSRDAVD